ncbi:MAG: hypothetical protein Ta2D_04440 [Rickettsiales bacterium]|nr:MAG: hypothetical protein Ta2D_04440 [Rickettsiales bacterium]
MTELKKSNYRRYLVDVDANISNFKSKYSEVEGKFADIEAKKEKNPDAFANRSFNLVKTNLEKAKEHAELVAEWENVDKQYYDMEGHEIVLSNWNGESEEYWKEKNLEPKLILDVKRQKIEAQLARIFYSDEIKKVVDKDRKEVNSGISFVETCQKPMQVLDGKTGHTYFATKDVYVPRTEDEIVSNGAKGRYELLLSRTKPIRIHVEMKKILDPNFFLDQAEKSVNELNNGYTRLSSFPTLTEKFAKETGSPIQYFDSVKQYNDYLKTLPKGAKVFGVVRVGSATATVPVSHCVAAYTEVGKDTNNTYIYDTLGEVGKKNKFYGFESDGKSKVVYTAKNTQKSDKGCFENSEFFLDVVARNNFTFKDLTKHIPTKDVKETGISEINDVKQFPTFAIKSLETETDRANLNEDIRTRNDKSFKYLSFTDNTKPKTVYTNEQIKKWKRFLTLDAKLKTAQSRVEKLGIEEEIKKFYSDAKSMKVEIGSGVFVEKLYNKNGTSKAAVDGETRLAKQEKGKAVIKDRQLANEKAFGGNTR